MTTPPRRPPEPQAGLLPWLVLIAATIGPVLMIGLFADTPAPRHEPAVWHFKVSAEQRQKILERSFEIDTRIQFPWADFLAYEPAGSDVQECRLQAFLEWRSKHGAAVEAVLQAIEEIIPAGVPR